MVVLCHTNLLMLFRKLGTWKKRGYKGKWKDMLPEAGFLALLWALQLCENLCLLCWVQKKKKKPVNICTICTEKANRVMQGKMVQ